MIPAARRDDLTIVASFARAQWRWRGDQVAVNQLVEDFARYLYVPRLAGPEVLAEAIRDGLALLTWQTDTFAFAESYYDGAGRYRGLRGGQVTSVSRGATTWPTVGGEGAAGPRAGKGPSKPPTAAQPKRC